MAVIIPKGRHLHRPPHPLEGRSTIIVPRQATPAVLLSPTRQRQKLEGDRGQHTAESLANPINAAVGDNASAYSLPKGFPLSHAIHGGDDESTKEDESI